MLTEKQRSELRHIVARCGTKIANAWTKAQSPHAASALFNLEFVDRTRARGWARGVQYFVYRPTEAGRAALRLEKTLSRYRIRRRGVS